MRATLNLVPGLASDPGLLGAAYFGPSVCGESLGKGAKARAVPFRRSVAEESC